MKKSIPPAAIIGAVVVVLLIIGFFAYKTFGGDPAAITTTPQQIKEMADIKKKVMHSHRDINGHYIEDAPTTAPSGSNP